MSEEGKNGTTGYEKFHDKKESNELKSKEKKKNKCLPQDGFKFIVAGCVLFALSLTIGVVIDTFTKKPVTGHGAVSSDSQICSDVGISILRQGGNAVDAAISSAICLAIVKPGSSGLASGGYMLLHTPAGKDIAIDFQFVAPGSATRDMFKTDKSKAEKGAFSVAVPGMLKGMALAHKKYGKLAWSSLIKPIIDICNNGFDVDKDTVDEITKSLSEFSDEMKKFFIPGGRIPRVGQSMKFHNLSSVLQRISASGADAFYSGSIAKSIVDVVKSNGGNLTEDDLKNYQAIETGVYNTMFNGYKVITTPVPSSGVVVLAALNLLGQLKLSAKDQKTSLNYHYVLEALKFVFAERTRLGDANFDKNITNLVKEILSLEKAVELSKKVSKNVTHSTSYYGPFLSSAETRGTTNVIVLGTNGDHASIISTIGSSFGSKLVTDHGITLNNGMSGFSLPGQSTPLSLQANYIEAGKRPLSAAAPVIAFHKSKPCSNQYITGSSGGTKAITATIQVLVDLLSYRTSAGDAMKKPRVHTQLLPDNVLAEGSRFIKAGLGQVLTDLKSMGHKTDTSATALGTVNIISQQNKDIVSVADDRKSGGTSQF
eukprot:gene11955-13192_t